MTLHPRVCRPGCGGRNSFCLSNSECCSGRCAGLLCSRPPSQCTVGDVAQELIEESHEVPEVEEYNVQEENEELVETQCQGGGTLCFKGADCCSGLCSGFLCRR